MGNISIIEKILFIPLITISYAFLWCIVILSFPYALYYSRTEKISLREALKRIIQALTDMN